MINIKNIYLSKRTITNIPTYNNILDMSVVDFPNENLCNNKKLKRVTISLPNELIKVDSKIILNELSRLVKYEFKNIYLYLNDKGHLNADIIYLDRNLEYDYTYAKSNTVYYIKSMKKMKDIRKYNKHNPNHLFIKKGEKLPSFSKINDEITIKYIKVAKLSNSFEDKKLYIKQSDLRKLKKRAVSCLNSLLDKVKSDKVYVTVKEYRELGFKTLSKYNKKYVRRKFWKSYNNHEIDKLNSNRTIHNIKLWNLVMANKYKEVFYKYRAPVIIEN